MMKTDIVYSPTILQSLRDYTLHLHGEDNDAFYTYLS